MSPGILADDCAADVLLGASLSGSGFSNINNLLLGKLNGTCQERCSRQLGWQLGHPGQGPCQGTPGSIDWVRDLALNYSCACICVGASLLKIQALL